MKSSITLRLIKSEFTKAEKTFEFCWQVLEDIKLNRLTDHGFAERFILFQDKLADTIFSLQSIRDKIILEEKEVVKNKQRYKQSWFLQRVRLLSNFKKGIDIAVNMAKVLGDAYAFFFYQNDRQLYTEHLSHQRIINHTAGLGERGELEFIKKVKHVEKEFTLYHGITNILRYGDFSFIDLKTFRVKQIGELKTNRISEDEIQLNMTIIRINELLRPESGKPKLIDTSNQKDKRERQISGIVNFFLTQFTNEGLDRKIESNSYDDQLSQLIVETKVGTVKLRKVSPGLAFSCVSYKKASLFHRVFQREIKTVIGNAENEIQQVAISLVKPSSNNNNLILGQLLQVAKNQDTAVRGTVPLFWHPIDIAALKKLHFYNTFVTSIFNPAYLVDELENLGFSIESAYMKGLKPFGPFVGEIKGFDKFFPYITEYLMHESFVIESISQVKASEFWGKKSKISIRPQQHMGIFQNIGKKHK